MENLKNKKGGSELIIFIVIVAVIAMLAYKTLPGMMTKVKEQNDKAETNIGAIGTIFD